MGWRVSGWLRVTVDPETAAAHFEHCLRLDPFSPRRAATLTGLGAARVNQRRHEEAIALFRQSSQLSAGSPTNDLMLAICHAHLGQLSEARAAADRVKAVSGTDDIRALVEPWATPWIRSRLARIESDG
jgi:tetratricopeptide (TPR) repeat protein